MSILIHGRCSGCARWDAYDDRPMGLCDQSEFKPWQTPGYDGLWTDGSLMTGPDFACVQWKARADG